MARVAPDDGPAAFDVSLCISSGRHSPSSQPYVIKVNADTKVHWFFVEGAYLLHSIHGRDQKRLQRDFDLYLKREGKDDICINPSREIAEYGIKRNDELEFRHKALPISVIIELYEGEKRTMEVKSGYPVMDIVPQLAEQFGIKNYDELSLARTQKIEDKWATQYQWLDRQSSLNGQGVQDGDTLLLRKKFFILNDDVQEALEDNTLLFVLLYHQIHDMFVRENVVGAAAEEMRTLAKMSCLLHQIEQGDENISNEPAASRVTPKCHQKNQHLYSQIITAFHRERVASLSKGEAKRKLLEFFLHPQAILVTYYPVKVLEDPTDYILVVDSNTVTLYTEEDNSLKPVEEKSWRLRDIRGADCTHKEQLVSVNVLGSWQEFSTSYTSQIASHVHESHVLMTKKIARYRLSARMTSPAPSPAPQPEPPQTTQVHLLEPVTPTPSARSTSPAATEEPAALALTLQAEESKPESEPSTPTPSPHSTSPPVTEEPAALTLTLITKVSKPEESGEGGADMSSQGSLPTTPTTAQVVTVITPTPLTPDVVEIPPTPEAGEQGAQSGEEEFEKRPLTPEDISTSVCIPEYFGLDYREVLKDYKLFYLVVANKDKRSLLLNIEKPVKKVIEDTCGIFGIHNPSQYHFWLPRGKEHIIQKYGGKPKKRIGRFLPRKSSSVPEPCLDPSRTLAEQYNFNIKPLVLHLHKHHPQEETDAPEEEVDMGKEWPSHENRDVKSYRQFYQSWCGVVQGAYPVEKEVAIKLAALLTHIYYGDRARYKVWPPEDYDLKLFLPEAYSKTFGISGDVEKVYSRLSGMTIQECIIEATNCCGKIVTHQGVFFDVSVPAQSDIMAVIRWKKMEPQLFGINSHGVFSVDRESGKVLFTHRFSDIYDWNYGENTFTLNFSQWSPDYHAYTYQTEEILDTLQLYIDMTRKGIISQAPSRPSSVVVEEQSQSQAKRATPQSFDISFSPDSSGVGGSGDNTTPRVTPQLNGQPESTPTGIEDAGIGITEDGTGNKEGGGDKDEEEEYHSFTGSPDDDIVEATV